MSRALMESPHKGGRRISGIFFDVIIRPAASFQVGVIVSKKVSLLSVERHLVKRRIMHALRDSGMSKLPIHVFIFTKKSILTASYAYIVGACGELIQTITASRTT